MGLYFRRQRPRGPGAQKTGLACPPVEEEETYPVHLLDQAKGYRFLLSWILCSNDVLDAPKLGASLSRLLEMGDWRKFAGRLRCNKDGRLTAHVPKTLTDKQPAILFHHTPHPDLSIDKHPLRNAFPKPQQQVLLHEYNRDSRPELIPPHFPKTFDELIKGDHPPVSLHVITFRDATILLLTWPHTMTDGPGHEALLRNWSLVLAGRESEVAPVLGARDDIVCQLARDAREISITDSTKWGLADKLHSRLLFLSRSLTGPPVTARMIYVPPATYEHLLAGARHELSCHPHQGTRDSLVSDADILLAWCSKAIAAAAAAPASKKPTPPILVLNVVNPRYRVRSLRGGLARRGDQEGATADPQRGVYVQNLSLPVYIQQEAATVNTSSTGALAALNRQQFARQATEGQMLALLNSLREQAVRSGANTALPVCGDPASTAFVFNNLSPMGLITAVDFSPAVLVPGGGGTPAPGGSGRLVSCALYAARRVTLSQFMPVGKDSAGGFWMQAVLDARQWGAVEERLRALKRAGGV